MGSPAPTTAPASSRPSRRSSAARSTRPSPAPRWRLKQPFYTPAYPAGGTGETRQPLGDGGCSSLIHSTLSPIGGVAGAYVTSVTRVPVLRGPEPAALFDASRCDRVGLN